jgi:hypothetical protein
MVQASSDPSEAAQLFPWNGEAGAFAAYDNFFKQAWRGAGSATPGSPWTDETGDRPPEEAAKAIVAAATMQADAARAAVSLEPLSTNAYAVLALAESNAQRRRDIIALASQLSKRDLALQDLKLGKTISDGSYEGLIETIDQILRVHPERSSRFFPLLIEALVIDQTLPQFANLLKNQSPWRDKFLNVAVSDQRALGNLAILREAMPLAGEAFDQKLIRDLANNRELTKSASVYRAITSSRANLTLPSYLDWRSTYPPLDWKLSSDNGRAVDVDPDGERLQLQIADGNGGIFASRMVIADKRVRRVVISHNLKISPEVGSFKISTTCLGETDPFFEGLVQNNSQVFDLSDRSSNCLVFTISLYARAWSGKDGLNGSVSKIFLS